MTFLLIFKQRGVLTVSFFLQRFLWNKAKSGRVHAVAEPGWLRTIVKHVTQMRVGDPAADLRPPGKERVVWLLDDISRLERPGETGPSRAGVVLVPRTEQRLARYDVHINPVFLVVPIGIVEWRFRGVLLRHFVLQRSQSPLDLVVTGFGVGFAITGRF